MGPRAAGGNLPPPIINLRRRRCREGSLRPTRLPESSTARINGVTGWTIWRGGRCPPFSTRPQRRPAGGFGKNKQGANGGRSSTSQDENIKRSPLFLHRLTIFKWLVIFRYENNQGNQKLFKGNGPHCQR